MALNVFQAIRRKPDTGKTDESYRSRLPVRLSGTNEDTETNVRPDEQLGEDNGRTGNDYTYPDWPRGRFDVGLQRGDRLQDFANTHMSEGDAPGRIPRQWNDRIHGKVGRGLTGEVSGETSEPITITGNAAGGTGDMKYVPHTPIPRGTIISRPYLRTVDDSAAIPAIYVGDPTRY